MKKRRVNANAMVSLLRHKALVQLDDLYDKTDCVSGLGARMGRAAAYLSLARDLETGDYDDHE